MLFFLVTDSVAVCAGCLLKSSEECSYGLRNVNAQINLPLERGKSTAVLLEEGRIPGWPSLQTLICISREEGNYDC